MAWAFESCCLLVARGSLSIKFSALSRASFSSEMFLVAWAFDSLGFDSCSLVARGSSVKFRALKIKYKGDLKNGHLNIGHFQNIDNLVSGKQMSQPCKYRTPDYAIQLVGTN